jgi:2,3-bisphosphoglycerate-dependent phosphoglycerate mutase
MHQLVLVRHGRSEWNERNLFTGWYDCPLTDVGRAEARAAGTMLTEANLLPDLVHTSTLQRAIETANLLLASCDRQWIPVQRSWRLNERHYGDLTGLDKAATRELHGDEQLQAWRRGYRTPPPPISPDNPYNPTASPAYAHLPAEVLPLTECLADVVDRLLPYWVDRIIPDLQAGNRVLVTAHGNSLRALVKHLDGISDDDITELNIPTGMPLYYELDEQFRPVDHRHPLERALDPKAAAQAAADVAKQAGGR